MPEQENVSPLVALEVRRDSIRDNQGSNSGGPSGHRTSGKEAERQEHLGPVSSAIPAGSPHERYQGRKLHGMGTFLDAAS